MFQYRNKKYEYTEWITYTGETASCYTCSEFSHAPFNFKSFSTSSKQRMHARIDDMLDNIERHEKLHKLNTYTASVFYETLTYKGD